MCKLIELRDAFIQEVGKSHRNMRYFHIYSNASELVFYANDAFGTVESKLVLSVHIEDEYLCIDGSDFKGEGHVLSTLAPTLGAVLSSRIAKSELHLDLQAHFFPKKFFEAYLHVSNGGMTISLVGDKLEIKTETFGILTSSQSIRVDNTHLEALGKLFLQASEHPELALKLGALRTEPVQLREVREPVKGGTVLFKCRIP